MSKETKQPIPASGFYLVIMAVLASDVVLGVAIYYYAEHVLQNSQLALFGQVLALIGAALYLFFRIKGRDIIERRYARQGGGKAGGGSGSDTGSSGPVQWDD